MTATATDIEKAAGVLRAGGLVALPTETVYGLGANAEDPAAIARIFQVKGRPPSHPLIVHIGSAQVLEEWVESVPAAARVLAEHFWPGPLTLVLRRGHRVPLEATGGLETVAVRVPDHPVALALLSAFGGGVTAPSANRFGQISPTSRTTSERSSAMESTSSWTAAPARSVSSRPSSTSRARPRPSFGPAE